MGNRDLKSGVRSSSCRPRYNGGEVAREATRVLTPAIPAPIAIGAPSGTKTNVADRLTSLGSPPAEGPERRTGRRLSGMPDPSDEDLDATAQAIPMALGCCLWPAGLALFLVLEPRGQAIIRGSGAVRRSMLNWKKLRRKSVTHSALEGKIHES